MTTTSGGPSRRTLVKGAAWSIPVVAVGSAAPAMASSPRIDPGINGWVLNSPTRQSDCRWRLRVDSNPRDYTDPTPDGAPFGLYLYDIQPTDEITNATMTYWIIGNQSATWAVNGGHSSCWRSPPTRGVPATKADGLTYTPYTWTYGCTIPSQPLADGRVWLGEFDTTATFTQPRELCNNVTYWTQRTIVVNGQVLTFERRNGTLGPFSSGSFTPQTDGGAAERAEAAEALGVASQAAAGLEAAEVAAQEALAAADAAPADPALAEAAAQAVALAEQAAGDLSTAQQAAADLAVAAEAAQSPDLPEPQVAAS